MTHDRTKMPSDQLTALHELAKSCPGEVEGCEWWPGCLRYEPEWYNEDCGPYSVWLYGDSIGGFEIDPQHALDLVTAEAERWLVVEGWEISKDTGGVGYEWWINSGENYLDKCLYTLHDALKHAMEHSPPA